MGSRPPAPAAWMWWKGSLAASRARKSTICRFMPEAPRDPQKDTTSGRPSSTPSCSLACCFVRVKKSSRTGVPVTTTFSGCL